MQAQPSILVVGSTMVDMISYLETLPDEGATIRGRSFRLGFGGKGANQAVMARLLGASVLMVNCVGDDLFGPATIDNMASFGIDTSLMRTAEGASSGVAPIWVEPNGSNRIVIVPGANDLISESQVELAFGHCPQPQVVLCQLEVPQAAVLRAFELGSSAGSVNVLNPAPAAAIDPAILALTSWLIPNESEFSSLCAGAGIRADNPSNAMAELARSLELNVVLTLGREGAVFCEAPDYRIFSTPAPVVGAVDTTGAGDAFVGAFAYAIASGQPAADAVALGVACGTESVTREGTQTSFPRADTIGRILMSLQAGTRY